ncbi:hypothetical protein EVAR_99973_1 [Eumeta japonica]|uniref:Uncharacterized protein n=1 Tax=Eumeta variegata TaxID=151549 RepID=A0A4C1ZJI7_EUMVA|nr:hypothetical protein EVAR_99973_1 [Eumeta japonica]
MSVASGDGGGGAACDCRRARGALLWWCCVLAATAGALGLLRTQQLEARVALLEQTVALHAVYPPAAPAQPAHALPLRREPRDANECICPPGIRWIFELESRRLFHLYVHSSNDLSNTTLDCQQTSLKSRSTKSNAPPHPYPRLLKRSLVGAAEERERFAFIHDSNNFLPLLSSKIYADRITRAYAYVMQIRPKPLRPSVIAGRSDTGRRQRPAAVAGDHRALGALTPSKKSKIRAREVGALVRRSATRRLAERGGPEPALTASVTISGGGSDQERVRRARAAGGPARSRETKQIVTAHRRAHYV